LATRKAVALQEGVILRKHSWSTLASAEDAKRLKSNGYGKAQPVANNNSEQGRAMNYGIEIVDRQYAPSGR